MPPRVPQQTGSLPPPPAHKQRHRAGCPLAEDKVPHQTASPDLKWHLAAAALAADEARRLISILRCIPHQTGSLASLPPEKLSDLKWSLNIRRLVADRTLRLSSPRVLQAAPLDPPPPSWESLDSQPYLDAHE